jgi:cytochrome bd ubiquinol oxidase subunit II
MTMDLPILTALFLTFSLCLYVLLDGFDLGVGALLLLEPDERQRDRMVDAITPTWDGNETWLIMAAITMLAGFPTAYSVLIPAFYLPLLVMLLSLGFRGVSFEFRYQTVKARRRWDAAFAVGSILVAFAQGAFVGGLIVGVAVDKGVFVGEPFDWFTPFSILFGFASLTGYAVLGAGWLHLKGEGTTKSFAEKNLRWVTPTFLLLSFATCFAAYQIQPQIAWVWGHHFVSMIILGGAFLLTGLAVTVRSRLSSFFFDAEPFVGGLIMFACALVGLVLTFAPNIVPFRISIWDAASPTASQVFLLIGALLVAPVVVGYNAFSYWVFRGKTPKEGWGE